MYNTLHCVSDDMTLYIVHHTNIERYIAARIYSVKINNNGDKSAMRLLSVNCLHVLITSTLQAIQYNTLNHIFLQGSGFGFSNGQVLWPTEYRSPPIPNFSLTYIV